jgi:hypothetical protein
MPVRAFALLCLVEFARPPVIAAQSRSATTGGDIRHPIESYVMRSVRISTTLSLGATTRYQQPIAERTHRCQRIVALPMVLETRFGSASVSWRTSR